jgi:predicted PurR-regulated permease PerM
VWQVVLEMPPLAGETGQMADPESRPLRLPPMSHYALATVTIVAVLAVIRGAFEVRNILILALVAAVLAVGLDPPVRRLERLGIKRGWAVAIIFLASIAFLLLFAALIVPPLVREVRQLAANIPDYITRLRSQSGWLGDLARKYDIGGRLQDLTDRLPTVASSSFSTVFGFTKGLASVIFNSLTVGILTIYFLLSLPRTKKVAVRLVTPRRRERAGKVQSEALDRIGGYVSGNILTSIIAGIASFIALTLIGVPFAAALAMWVAIADLIPAVGATLGASVAVVVAAFSSIGDAVVTTIFFIVYQQVENYVIVPRIMKKAVDLSPAAVIVSTLIGGSLAGFAGALIALPVAATIKVIIQELWMSDRLDAEEVPATDD